MDLSYICDMRVLLNVCFVIKLEGSFFVLCDFFFLFTFSFSTFLDQRLFNFCFPQLFLAVKRRLFHFVVSNAGGCLFINVYN